MKRRGLETAVLVVAACAMVLAGCGTGDGEDDAGSAAPSPGGAGTRASEPARHPTPSSTKEETMRIEITIDDQHLQATLDDSAASRDLLGQLPQTVEMRDHGGVEKTGPLRSALSLEGQPTGADPSIGDVGYYVPGGNFVLYYGDQSYYEGIVILGHLDGDAAERIAQMDGDIIVSIDIIS
jgi:predicted small secreted protein